MLSFRWEINLTLSILESCKIEKSQFLFHSMRRENMELLKASLMNLVQFPGTSRIRRLHFWSGVSTPPHVMVKLQYWRFWEWGAFTVINPRSTLTQRGSTCWGPIYESNRIVKPFKWEWTNDWHEICVRLIFSLYGVWTFVRYLMPN